MLTPAQLFETRWHPLRHTRGSNYALNVKGWYPMTTEGMQERNGVGARPGYRLFYLMACGHRSLPGLTTCVQGCLTAPEYPQLKSVEFPALTKRAQRLKINQTLADGGEPKPSWRLPRGVLG